MKSARAKILFLAAPAFVGAIGLLSLPAGAAYINHAAQVCGAVDASTAWNVQTFLTSTNQSAESKFVCPIRTDNRHPHGSMTSLHAHVDDRNTFNGTGGKVRVAACVAYSLSFGGVCGTTAATSGTGTGGSDLTVPHTKLLENPGEYPYLYLTLPKYQSVPSGQDGASKLRGFTSDY
jgi:hypothetical protein